MSSDTLSDKNDKEPFSDIICKPSNFNGDFESIVKLEETSIDNYNENNIKLEISPYNSQELKQIWLNNNNNGELNEQLNQLKQEPNQELDKELDKELNKELDKELNQALNEQLNQLNQLKQELNQELNKEQNKEQNQKQNQEQNQEQNQTSSTYEIKADKIDQYTNTKRKLSDDPTLILGYNLRDDLTNTFLKLSTLINAQSTKSETKKELAKKINNLVQRLSALLVGENESKLKENLTVIDENLLEDLNGNEYDVYFELKWETRQKIIDILMRNYSFIVLFSDSDVCEKSLCKENNELARLLIDLDTKPFVNLDLVKNRRTEDDPPFKRSKLDNEKLHSITLNFKSRIVDTKSNKLKFDFALKGIEELLKFKKKVCSDFFSFLTRQWFVQVRSNQLKDNKTHLGIFLCVRNVNGQEWSQKLTFDIMVLHPLNLKNRKLSFFDRLFKEGNDKWGLNAFIAYDRLNEFKEDNTIKLRIQIDISNLVDFNSF